MTRNILIIARARGEVNAAARGEHEQRLHNYSKMHKKSAHAGDLAVAAL